MSIEAGSILRETREQKGVSIKEASDSLHIRIPYLQALETGRAEIIPSAVQARGFLRIYAEYLNLNAADVIQEWDKPGTTKLSAKPDEQQIEQHTLSNSSPGIPAQAISQSPYNTSVPASGNPTFQPISQNPVNIPVSQNSFTNFQQTQPNPVYSPSPEPAEFSPETVLPDDKHTKKDKKSKKQKSDKKSSGKRFSLFKKKSVEASQKQETQISAQDLFNDIGMELANRRKFLALSLEDCESQTLIRSMYLESMENGSFEQLPSLIQARGMLNNYASFLDLDVESVMLKFATALQQLSDKKNRRDEEKKRKPTKRAGRLKKFFTPDLFVGIFVIVGIAGIIIYSAITITAYRRSMSEPTPALGISLLEQYLDTTRTPEFLPTASATVAPAVQNANTGIGDNEQEETESVEITSSQPVQLFVNANQRALMTVRSDGREVFSGRTLPNNTYPFDAENLIELTISNADAISIVYNQQNLGRPGRLGEVMTINFSPYSAATPTPQFSPTPTNTYEPTYTPQPETPLPTNTPTPYIP